MIDMPAKVVFLTVVVEPEAGRARRIYWAPTGNCERAAEVEKDLVEPNPDKLFSNSEESRHGPGREAPFLPRQRRRPAVTYGVRAHA